MLKNRIENTGQPAGIRAAALAGGLIVFFAAACAGLLTCHRYFQGGQSYEFCHYSEMAENLRSGHGLTSMARTPGQMAALDASGANAAGKIFDGGRFPLNTILVALAQAVFGGGDFPALAAGILAHSLWAAAVFVCGLLFFSVPAAFAAALLWAVNPALTAGLVAGGHPDLLSGFFCTLSSFLFIDSLEKRRSARSFFLLGLLFGLAYLSRFTLLALAPLVPVFAIGVLGWRNGARISAALAAGAALPAIPWLIYAGIQPQSAPSLFWTQLAANTIAGATPWQEYRLYGPQDFAVPGIAALLALKWASNFLSFLREAPKLWFLYLAVPAALAYAISSFARKQGPRLLLAFYGAALLLQLAGFSLLRHETLGICGGRYYLWMGPLLLLAACQFVFELGEKTGRKKTLALFAAANLLIFGYCYSRIETGSGHPSGRPVPLWQELIWARQLPPDAVVLSNIPIQTAWYAKRESIGITTDPAQMPALLKKHKADYLLLSPSAAGEQWHYPAWGAIARLEPNALEQLKKESGFILEKAEDGAALFKRLPPKDAVATSAPARSRPKAPARAR